MFTRHKNPFPHQRHHKFLDQAPTATTTPPRVTPRHLGHNLPLHKHPHQEGITACSEALNTCDTEHPLTRDLCHLIKLILIRDSFTFDSDYHFQVYGTAIETWMAPLYSNLFVGELEQQLLQRLPQQPTVWWRYIDDVLLI